MTALLLWLILLVLCWPLAILALLLSLIVWVILLPFRILGIAIDRVLSIMRAIILLPAGVLQGKPRNSTATAGVGQPRRSS